MSIGRRSDLTPVSCPDCGWEGFEFETRHGYMRTPYDVEPWDFCPDCGGIYIGTSKQDKKRVVISCEAQSSR